MPILGVAGDIVPRNKKERAFVLAPKHAKKRLSGSERRRLRDIRRATFAKSKQRLKAQKPKPPKEPGGRLCERQLYALELEEGRYYVGMTSYADAQKRFNQHAGNKSGAMWTKKYRPIRIIETRKLGVVRQSEAARAENDMTLEYMKKYGTAIVRGGDMCSLNHAIVAAKYQEHIERRKHPFIDPYQIELGAWYRQNF